MKAPAAAHRASAADTLPSRLTDQELWQLVVNLSENGGFFRSDNLLSNESIFIMFAFFWLCILSDVEAFSTTLGYFLPKVANAGHAAGLIAGSLWGFRDASRLS